MNCIVITHPEFQQLLADTGLSIYELDYIVSKWQEKTEILHRFPSTTEVLEHIRKTSNFVVKNNIKDLNISNAQIQDIYNNYVNMMDRKREGKSIDFKTFKSILDNLQVFNYAGTYVFGEWDSKNMVFKARLLSSPNIKELFKAIDVLTDNVNWVASVPEDIGNMLAKKGLHKLNIDKFYNFKGEDMVKNLYVSNKSLIPKIFGVPEEEVTKEQLEKYDEYYRYWDLINQLKEKYANKDYKDVYSLLKEIGIYDYNAYRLSLKFISGKLNDEDIKNAISQIIRGSILNKVNIDKTDLLNQPILYAKLNTELNKNLATYLSKFGITTQVLEDTEDALQTDSLGVLDILNKVIYVSKNDQTNYPTEASKLIAYMMQHNPLVREITTSLQAQPKFRNATKEELLDEIGNLISEQLHKKTNTKIPSSLSEKIAKLIKEFLNYISSLKLDRINRNINTITDNILAQNQSLITSNPRKPGEESKDANLINLQDALDKDPFATYIVDKMASDFILTGSIAISEQGTIYRPDENQVHDLDWISSFDLEKTREIFNKLFPNSPFVRQIVDENNESTLTWLVAPEGYKITDLVLEGAMKTITSYNVRDSENNIVSSFDIKHPEFEEKIKTKPVDIFVNSIESYAPFSKVLSSGTTVKLSNWRNTFKAKLKYGRLKDIWDYNRFVPSNESQSTKTLAAPDSRGNTVFINRTIGLNEKKQYSLQQIQNIQQRLKKSNAETGRKDKLVVKRIGQADLHTAYVVLNHNRPVNPKIQEALQGNNPRLTVRDFLLKTIEISEGQVTKDLAKHLLQISTQYVLGLPINLANIQDNGTYESDTDNITVNNTLKSVEHALKVGLHEIAHALTTKEYRNNPEFRQKINALLKSAREQMDTDLYQYQLGSGEEFIAGIYNNGLGFTQALAQTQGINKNYPNLLQQFIAYIQKLFKLSENPSLLENLLFEIEEIGKSQQIKEKSFENNQYDMFEETDYNDFNSMESFADPADFIQQLHGIPKPINPDDIKASPKFQKILQTVRQSLQDRQKELQSQYGADRIETKSRLNIIKASLGKLSPQAGVYDLLSVSDKDLREAEKVLNKTYEDIDFFELMETKRILLFQSSFDEQLASEDLTEEQEYIIQQQRAKNTKLLHKFNKLITKKLSEASKDFGREITEEDLQKAYKDMSYWNAQTLSLDQSNIPHLQFAKEIINWRKRKTQEDLRNFAKELEELTKKFGEEEFKKIFDAEHLITKYKQEFFDSEREIWAEHHRIMKDPNMSTKDKSASFARVDNFYRDNFTYSLSDKGKQLYEEHKKEFIENNTFINEKGQQEVNQEAVNEWIHENSWESMGRIEKDGTFIFERNTPKTLNINGKIIDSKGWHRYLMKEPIQEHWNPKYDSVKDLEVYKWYTDKAKEIIQKIPHEMTADLDMYDKFLDQITLDLTQSKMDLETIYKGVEETALDWFTVGISLQEARGEDLKLTDEKGRPKPLVKATELKNVKGKSPLEILTKAYSMAVTYEHKVEIQPMLDLLLYQVENLKALPTNRFGIPFANKETAQGLINASNALRFSSSADLTGISRTDEHLGTANISEHERLMLESGEKSIIRKASAVKIADTIVDYSRLTMIGLKPFTAAANLVIGISNNYMYAARKRDFTDKDLDWALTKMFGSIFNFWTMGKLQDKNVLPKDAEKIAMLALNYDIIPENLIEDRSQYGKVSKAFNKITEILFKMQEGGEYLIATQLLLAKMHFTKITDLSGKERTLYDAYDQNGNWKTKEFGDRPEWTELTHKNSEGLNTSKLKIFKDQFEQVRSNTQGDYQNPIQAKSKILGRILFMFRTWLPRSIHSRFGEENTFNNTKGRYISMASGYRKAFGKEGYKGIGKKFFGGSLVVLAKLTNLPLIGQHIAANPIANWAEKEYEAYLKDLGLTDLDIENVRVNIREMQYIALMMLVAMALKGLADDDKNPMLNFSINLAYRTYQDLSFYASPSSAMNIIKDPIPIWKTIQDFNDVVNAGMILITDPSKDTYQKGLHKGDSKFAKELGDMFIISSAWNSTQSTMNQIFNQDAYKYQKK